MGEIRDGNLVADSQSGQSVGPGSNQFSRVQPRHPRHAKGWQQPLDRTSSTTPCVPSIR